MNIKDDLVINNPTIIQEWDYKQNNLIGLYPDKVTTGSNKIAYWICNNCGKSYQTSIKSKLKSKYGCPNCVRKFAGINSRKTKVVGVDSLAKSHPHLMSEWLECEDTTLTPYNVTAGSGKKVKWKCPNCNGIYLAIISSRALKNSNCPYCAGIKVLTGVNDLQTVNPHLAAEWSDKNDRLPTEFLPHSHYRAYWKCPVGHNDYPNTIKARSDGRGCPICARESQTSFPEQAIYYFIKQVFLDAENRYRYAHKTEIDIFIPSSQVGIEYNGYYAHKNRADKDIAKKKFLTDNGVKLFVIKEFKAENEKYDADFYIQSNYDYKSLDKLIESLLLTLCKEVPIDINTEKHFIKIQEQYLSIRKANSIVAKLPNIIEEWDYELNGKINPEFVSASSNQKYYWKCKKCNVSYLSSAKNKAIGQGCPYCAGIKVLTGVNDFATRYPELLVEWDYDKNKKKPYEIYGGGHSTAYFKCKYGHSYKRKIEEKIKGQGCPYCAGKKVLEGFNDLLSQRADLSLDWDYSKNKITPDKVHANSFKKYFWKCHICGFEWKYAVTQRIHCPSCTSSNKKINVYTFDGILIGSYIGRIELCKALDIQLKSYGNISSVCMRKQKTLLSKYVLRYDRDDEFKEHTQPEIKSMLADYLGDTTIYGSKQNPFINVYDIISFKHIATYNGLNEVCAKLGIKTKSNVCSVCQRKQRTILSRYILRYDYDDEFKRLTNLELKNKIQDYLIKK